jgi:hypothetical protein
MLELLQPVPVFSPVIELIEKGHEDGYVDISN